MTKQISLIVIVLIIIGAAIFLLSGKRPSQAPAAPAVSAPAPTEQQASQPQQPAASNTSGPINLPLPPNTIAPAPSTTTPPAGSTNSPQASPEPAVKEFTMTAKRFTFDPAQITVNLNDRVRIKVTSIDVAHGIGIAQFNVSVVLPPNETKIVEFTADKRGTFRFLCSVYCGAGHGDMKGALIVQ